jgi:hypothetical protein
MSLRSNTRFVGASHIGCRLASFAIVGAFAVGLSACSGGGSSGGDPGARPLPSGMSCQSLRADLNKMDSQGAQSKVEAASQGKASPEAKAVADRYNTLLNHYLGARCHV